jgi:hypothetical protein
MKIFLAMRWALVALVAPEKTFRSQKESLTNLREGASIDELVWIDVGRPIGTCPSETLVVGIVIEESRGFQA